EPNQCDAIFTSPPHPADWTNLLSAHAAMKAPAPAPAPNATVAATDPNRPARNIVRPPTKSPATPVRSLPTAEKKTPVELTAPMVSRVTPRPRNSARIAGVATDRSDRQR